MAFVERAREKSSFTKVVCRYAKREVCEKYSVQKYTIWNTSNILNRLLITLKPKANAIIAWIAHCIFFLYTLCIRTLHACIRPKYYVFSAEVHDLAHTANVLMASEATRSCQNSAFSAPAINMPKIEPLPPSLAPPPHHTNPAEVTFHVWWMKALPSPAWNLMWRKRFRCHL